MLRTHLENAWREAGLYLRLKDLRHGHLERWIEVIDSIPDMECKPKIAIGSVVSIGTPENLKDEGRLRRAIKALIPWRKGPFSLYGEYIDAEWRSNLKWDRIAPHINATGKHVLDVGCGNGYFCWRLYDAGATRVTGIDSNLLTVMQNALTTKDTQVPIVVLPLRFGVDFWQESHELVLSMGVLYHQRDPSQHVRDLWNVTAPGGTLVLETISAEREFSPDDRYAGMRNVWHIPSPDSVHSLLANTGYNDIAVVDQTKTNTREQRSTPLMPYQSLADVLDSSELKTIEGYPAPVRTTIIAKRPLSS